MRMHARYLRLLIFFLLFFSTFFSTAEYYFWHEKNLKFQGHAKFLEKERKKRNCAKSN